MAQHHPWRAIRALADWTVHWTGELPEGVDAATRWADRTIWLRFGLSQVQRRCIIEHERQHIIRGPGGHELYEERSVDVATAHSLIRLDELMDAARWARSMPELADELNVTEDVVHVRLRHLHPSERALLRRAAVEAGEESTC
ncbi:hypothetical protein [Intrasporangium flavum]|uniref:hypothetical protein n=1 Tax=Intrasporangium flavum TaxID=1428657 RepID=UPI00096BE433|nr:hypothetical protein [Intrasporangium flavum]